MYSRNTHVMYLNLNLIYTKIFNPIKVVDTQGLTIEPMALGKVHILLKWMAFLALDFLLHPIAIAPPNHIWDIMMK